jgi:NAD(P)H dehydrogenase (quinone)
MKTIIVYAHPETKGHNSYLLETVKKQLDKKNSSYEILDLYSMKYDPVLHESEHYTAGNTKVSALNKRIQQKFSENDHFIFIYPLWWDSMPAILKGFFDKVFTSPFAFSYKKSIPQGHLKGKRAVTFVTHGGPALFYSFVLLNRGTKIVTKDILGFCGIHAKHFGIYNASHRVDSGSQEKMKKTVHRGLAWLYRN